MSLLVDQVPEGADIGPAQIKAYLMSSGWRLIRADSGSASELWEAETGGPRRTQVVVPTDSTYVDFPRRLSDSLQRLCEIYDWSLGQLIQSVQSIRSDLLYIRADQLTRFDSIPLKQAENLIAGTLQMLQSAAWSTLSPRASLSGRKPDAVKQFLDDDLRMGHTRRGSFILTILARVDDEPVEVEDEGDEEAPNSLDSPARDVEEAREIAVATEPTLSVISDTPDRVVQSREETRFILPPFQRRVMSTLALGLEETKSLTEASDASHRLESAVARGVSAQLCDSLTKMTSFEGLRSLGMSFQWAPLPFFDPPTISEVSINRDNIGELEGLRERLKAREKRPDARVTIYGRVVRLERNESGEARPGGSQGEAEAVVTVLGVEGKKTRRRVKVEVSGAHHQIAIRSYDQQRPISVTGELRREGQGYWLRGDVAISE